MRCTGCKHSIIEEDTTGGDRRIVVFCEHEKFLLPRRVVDGFEIYLNELENSWQPDVCPLEPMGD